MKVSKRSPKSTHKIEFSKEFLAEFGLSPNKHEALTNKDKAENKNKK
ncbi:hypothetical protein HNQ80_002300 [Anaerosolibacter carboniphilus]|uniref:Uncharacterized protein n=1 Tax=Anaerosolibacter carboniphilus TaxID=1417629 RepID=A0A841KS40_9FIRM|nr:hypothetical protein [Anaerosolibacter carboniphilus]MBB6216201.1 hypothetical protein [Anaerosolibacter carboniphilus]